MDFADAIVTEDAMQRSRRLENRRSPAGNHGGFYVMGKQPASRSHAGRLTGDLDAAIPARDSGMNWRSLR